MAIPSDFPNLWHASAPEAPRTAPLDCPISVDTAIIGGGFTGLSAALHLAQKGVAVAVLEARMVGFGGSGRNVGLVNAGMWTKPDDLIATLGETVGNRLLDELGGGPALVYELVEKHDIPCEAVRNGTLHMALGKAGVADIRARHDQWKKRGAPVELLDEAQAASISGARGFSGALLDKRAGTIQPLAYARGLARAALDAGARIYTDTPLMGATRKGDLWVLTAPNGSVTARNVIVATNAYGGMVKNTPWRAHIDGLTLLPYFQFATKPLSDNIARSILPERQGTWDTGMVMTSFRMDEQNRLIYGSIGTLDGLGKATHQAFARRAVRQIFPFLGDITFDYWWDGRIGMTDNNLPKLHQLDENVVSVSGYNGRGIAPGTVFGRALAQYVTGDVTAIPLAKTDPSPDTFRRIKSSLYSVGALAKHMIDRRF